MAVYGEAAVDKQDRQERDDRDRRHGAGQDATHAQGRKQDQSAQPLAVYREWGEVSTQYDGQRAPARGRIPLDIAGVAGRRNGQAGQKTGN